MWPWRNLAERLLKAWALACTANLSALFSAPASRYFPDLLGAPVAEATYRIEAVARLVADRQLS